MTIEVLVEELNSNNAQPEPQFTKDVWDRQYIGGSNVGHACERSIALRLRGYPTDPITPSKQRIFDDGHRIEVVVVGMLREVMDRIDGVELTHTGAIENQRENHYYGLVCRTHADGVLKHDGVESLLEVKSANDNSFRETKRLGMKYAHPEYYDQMQLMMGLNNMSAGLFIMYNKNNSKTYSETVYFNLFTYKYLLQRIEHIAAGEDERGPKVPTDFRCNLCSYVHCCWFGYELPKKYRTCRHCMWSVVDDSNAFCVCTNPLIDRPIPFIDSFKAQDCGFFKDHREKDNYIEVKK